MSRKRNALIAGLIVVPLLSYAAVAELLLPSKKVSLATRAPTTSSSSTSSTTSSLPGATTTTAASASSTTSAGTTASTFPKRADEPVAASNPKDLAAQISTAEAAVHDPSSSTDQVKRQAHVAQVAYRALVNHPDLQTPTFNLLAANTKAAAQDNVAAGAKLRSMITKPKSTLPAWRIVTPAPADELLGYYKESEAATGIPWQYLAAIHLVETRMGRIRGTSVAGAQGPMQFLTSTFNAYGNGGDINSNHDSIMAAGRLLAHNGAPGNLRSALYSYNHDYRYVEAITLYAERMRTDERAYVGYHDWQVYYVTTSGDVWLWEGWSG